MIKEQMITFERLKLFKEMVTQQAAQQTCAGFQDTLKTSSA